MYQNIVKMYTLLKILFWNIVIFAIIEDLQL